MSRKRTHDDQDDDAEMHDADKSTTTEKQPDPESSGSEESADDGEGSTVDVDFEFFEPTEIDFHGMKSLLKSSFGDDAQDFDISGLADIILEQGEIGSTVKVDGEDSDPYALLTVVDLNRNSEKPVVLQLKDYLLKKAEKAKIAAKLSDILNTKDKNVGLLISERVVNVPPQVVAPMLRMLVDEMKTANEAGESYNFEHFLLICPLYKDTEAVSDDPEDDSDSDDTSGNKNKKPLVSIRRQGKSSNRGTANNVMDMPFETHVYAEEEFIEEFACLKFDYKFTRTKRAAESRNSFAESGLSPFRRCLVIHKSKLTDLIDRLNDLEILLSYLGNSWGVAWNRAFAGNSPFTRSRVRTILSSFSNGYETSGIARLGSESEFQMTMARLISNIEENLDGQFSTEFWLKWYDTHIKPMKGSGTSDRKPGGVFIVGGTGGGEGWRNVVAALEIENCRTTTKNNIIRGQLFQDFVNMAEN
ncbi:Mss4p nuclear export [Coemansia sp. RSA 1813]|nr:Mss4p nuclear export [Coemansia sp. RSA 1646]KAJ1771822.1 Mss4p nuclear export [Coemansia sp. RSA 1843]KAJ2216035.1 Mss4p nuclear export [Coemansia sp. RSA 487]KAJ2570449.1 Mss4p nuclear export [Coemansia sp. RSA 1813]